MPDPPPSTDSPVAAVGPVVGREHELSLVRRFLEAGSTAAPACLVLSGEAGIGKTTLWEQGLELARQLGFQVLLARTSEAESALSFAGLADLLEGIADEDLQALPAPQLRALEVTVGRADPVAGPPDAYAVSAGFLGAVAAAARRAPVLVAVDDLPWLDVPSSGPLLFAARRLPREQARFLVTKRSGPRSELERALLPVGVEQVDVAPLSIGAIARVLSERLGLTLPRRALRRVHEGSHGNPLFALELGRLLGEEGEPEPGAELPLPDVAEDLLGSRIDRAGEPVRRILLALALSGGLTMAELARLVDPLAIEDAVASGLVVTDGQRVRPANPMLAAAARRRAGAPERRALHLDLASAVGDPLQKARHRAIATPRADEDAAGPTAAAADRAARSGRIAEAVTLGEHALRLTPADDGAIGERVLALAGYLWTAGDTRQMRELLDARMGDIPPGRSRAFAHLLLCERDSATDESEVERALAEAGSDPEVSALVSARRALDRAIWQVGRLDEAEDLAAAAVASARLVGPSARERAAAVHAWVRVLRGKPVDDLAEIGVVSPTDRSMEDASIGRPLGVRHAFRGELAEATAVFDHLVALADERGELRSLGSAQLQRCEVALRAGRAHELRHLLEDLEEVFATSRLGREVRRTLTGRVRALLAAVAGDPEQAVHWAADVLGEHEGATGQGGSVWDRLECERALGIAALLERDVEEAVGRLQGVWDHTRREGVDDPGAFPVAGDLVEALVEAGRTSDAAAVLDELRRLSTEQEHPWGLATCRRGAALVRLALADRYLEEAAEELAAAAADYGRLGLDFERARTLLSVGSIQRRFNKRAAARASLEEASAAFARWGSTGWAARADDELSRVSGRRPAPEDRLTPTEERVVRLAAEGLSNKEIARQLFVSVNTVEGHLSRAYAKLGVSSRGQLARRLEVGAED